MQYQLCIHFKGQLASELELCVDTQYIMGRSDKAQIQLNKDQSISRQHLSLQFENDTWQVKKLSQLGQLIHQGHEVQKIQLAPNDSFSTGFYTFYYVQKQVAVPAEDRADAEGIDNLEAAGIEGDMAEGVGSEAVPYADGAVGADQNAAPAGDHAAIADNEVENQNLEGQNLEGQNLEGQDLEGQDLEGQDLEGQDLARQDLSGSGLAGEGENFQADNGALSAGAEALDNGSETGEGTHISSQHLAAVLTIIRPDKYGGEKHLSISLEGQSWRAGRSKDCPIYIKSSKMSRQHFEITRQDNSFFVTDLESSNGTKLNGVALTPNQKTPLLSDDTLKVKNIQFQFKIQQLHQHEDMTHVFNPVLDVEDTNTYRDENFNPEALPAGMGGDVSPVEGRFGGVAHVGVSSRTARAVGVAASGGSASGGAPVGGGKKSKKMWAVLFALIVFGLWGVLGPQDGARKPASQKTGAEADKNNKNSKSQAHQLKDLYEVAHAHYVQGKYELCLDQIKKIVQIKADFELAMQLKTHCHQALQMYQFNEQRQKQAKKRTQNQQQVQAVIKTCQLKKHQFKSLAQLQQCLGPAIELDPENPGLSELEIFVENKLQTQGKRQARLKKQQRRYNQAEVEFNKALKYFDNQQIEKALKTHKQVIKKYSDVEHWVAQSTNKLNEIKEYMDSKTQTQFNECQSAFDTNEYKKAFALCQGVLKIDRRHKKARQLMKDITQRVCKKTKTLLTDANFHEYGGNIVAAKEKLRAILDSGVPQCPQYAKAKRLLKKYGMGDKN